MALAKRTGSSTGEVLGMRFSRMSAVSRAVQSAGIPLLVVSMVVTTAIAGIPGYFILADALGPERSNEALRVYAVIALCTAVAEGVALAFGIFIFWRLSRRIKTLNDEIRLLVRNVLHDIRTPISHISNAAQRILGGDGCAEDAAADISESCSRILSIVNANVEITNNYARVAELPPGEEDFSAVVAEAVELFSAVADMKGVSLSLETPSSPVVLAAHRHKLQQLAGNLIDNAIKFTPSGGNVTVSLSETRDSVIFKVTDSGVGIAKSDLPKIYDRFFRAERSRDTPGSGLGLSLVRAIVTFYDGDIDCKSKPDSGTVFAVTIPKRK